MASTNNVVHGNGKESISGSVVFLIKYDQEVCAAQDKTETAKNIYCRSLFEEQQLPPSTTNADQWVPPPAGVLKLNTDAAFEAGSGRSAGRSIV